MGFSLNILRNMSKITKQALKEAKKEAKEIEAKTGKKLTDKELKDLAQKKVWEQVTGSDAEKGTEIGEMGDKQGNN